MPATLLSSLPFTSGREETMINIIVYLKNNKEVVLSFARASLIMDIVEISTAATIAGCDEETATQCIEAISEGEWGPAEKEKSHDN